MEDFLKMDIFFVTATVALVVICALMTVALVYVVRILRTIARISEEVEAEAIHIRADIEDVRLKVKREGMRLAHITKLFEKTGKRLIARGRHKT